jgi:hypothetical protein
MASIIRSQAGVLRARLSEPRGRIQVIVGPRQVGKTTLVRWALQTCGLPAHYATSDDPGSLGDAWLAQQWEVGRQLARRAGQGGAVLALDELQKLQNWSEQLKRLWDEDTAKGTPLSVVVLGSSALLLQRGLTESLAGRFEVIRVPHWSFEEMHRAFTFSLEQYLVFGGYPGAALLVSDPARWARYVRDSLIETTLNLDVLQLTRVDKPVLLRRLFELACLNSGQELSYQKMLGQLHDAGNTVTLAHYLRLLEHAGMVRGLAKYTGEAIRQRASSPKLQVFNTALMAAMTGDAPEQTFGDPQQRGRLVESAVGAHLINAEAVGTCRVWYWRERSMEVDFVVECGNHLLAIEVKSGRRRTGLGGIAAFLRTYPRAKPLLVGADGIELDQFLLRPIESWCA